MIRTLVLLAIVASWLTAAQQGHCRLPDQVVNSPIPPLQAQADRNGERRRHGSQRTSSRLDLPLVLPSAVSSVPAPTHPVTSHPPTDQQYAEQRGYHSEALRIWTSESMREARGYVMKFCERSAATSPAEGEKFLKQLSVLSADEMKEWLARFESRRASIALQSDIEQLARRLMVEQALSRQEAMRQAYANVSQLRSLAASEPSPPSTLSSVQLRFALYVEQCEPAYDPMEAVIDPMSPRGEGLEVAAAMSLPGDLPRSDPRNFERGVRDDNFVDVVNETRNPQAAPVPERE